MTFAICKSKEILAICAIVISIVLAGSATAQTGSAIIQGTVTDQQGAVVAGATVKLSNESRGYSRTAVTSSSGAYSFSSVPPDTYQLSIEANGFKKLVQSKVSALVDKTSSFDAMLEPGAVSEVVNVSADGLESIVNTQDASLGNNFVSRQILQLPLQGP
ncbi:MAG: carboxypeptidase regulatory-like domain-containing protein [Chloracidobacterium sp.]|nr:carboxypeptidase regulatory-like domain-containing protein [Chloracidobacterium sp.]